MNKPVVLLSVFLSAIVLALVGGVIYTAKGAGAVAEPAPEVDQALVDALQERELVYQQMLDEANARIEAANVMLGKPQNPVQAPNDGVPASPAPVLAQITPEEAAALASDFISETGVSNVETTDYEGVASYEVLFNSGSVVYVSLEGQVLAYELAPYYAAPVDDSIQVSAEQFLSSNDNSSNGDFEGHDYEDHEDHEDNGGYDDD